MRLTALATVGFLTAPVATAAPAVAQPGPRTIPHVSSFDLVPAANGWTAFVHVVRLDGGEALRALDVRLKGPGRTMYTGMTETARAGTYRLPLPAAEPGRVRLALQVRPGAGDPRVARFDASYLRTLRAGDRLQVVASSPSSRSGDAARPGLFVLGIIGLLAVLFMCSVLAVRVRAEEQTVPNG
jgi:hypothetical protein